MFDGKNKVIKQNFQISCPKSLKSLKQNPYLQTIRTSRIKFEDSSSCIVKYVTNFMAEKFSANKTIFLLAQFENLLFMILTRALNS